MVEMWQDVLLGASRGGRATTRGVWPGALRWLSLSNLVANVATTQLAAARVGLATRGAYVRSAEGLHIGAMPNYCCIVEHQASVGYRGRGSQERVISNNFFAPVVSASWFGGVPTGVCVCVQIQQMPFTLRLQQLDPGRLSTPGSWGRMDCRRLERAAGAPRRARRASFSGYPRFGSSLKGRAGSHQHRFRLE